MRRVVLIVPSWLSAEGEDSVLRAKLPALEAFAERSLLRKCVPIADVSTPEAAWLGIEPSSIALQDGPLIVSAFGYDPPDRSAQFQLSLLSLVEGVAKRPKVKIPEAELDVIWEATKSLNTKVLTAVRGEGTEHGLVWEDGSLELGTISSSEMEGKAVDERLPEGDGERMLRRFIDDSINLLSELELNRARSEEGLEPLNLWWPWGQGFRTATPNLALKRGETCRVESASIRLQGLTRLCGYRHGDRGALRAGLRTDLEYLVGSLSREACSIGLIDVFGELRTLGRQEEMDWFTKELDRRLFAPLWDLARLEPLSLTLVAPGLPTAADEGLALTYSSGAVGANTIPFDERALEERTLDRAQVWSVVNQALIS